VLAARGVVRTFQSTSTSQLPSSGLARRIADAIEQQRSERLAAICA